MSVRYELAEPCDLLALLPLAREFYALEKLPFDEQQYRSLLTSLVANPEFGRLIVVFHNTELIGYLVMGFGFSLEFGGRDALIDEFYLREPYRGRGTGTAVLEYAERLCREAAIRAVHLEADHVNVRVHEYYLRMGFRDHARHLMTKWL